MLQKYVKNLGEIYKTNDFLEHTFRTAFENLLKEYLHEKKYSLTIIHEPKREKFGAPDFKIVDKASNTIGYIECKEITENINNIVDSEQIKKYLKVSNNLILTNYVDFILFKNKEIFTHCSITSILDLKNNKPKIKESDEFFKILEAFFLTTPEKITNKERLSLELANRTQILHDCISKEMNDDISKSNHFFAVYNIFKTIINDLPQEQYIDMYSQIISFGLLFFRLSKDIELTKENVISNIPHFIPLLKDVFHNARFDKWNNETLWILDEILLLINNGSSPF